jgi:hypothetical protein
MVRPFNPIWDKDDTVQKQYQSALKRNPKIIALAPSYARMAVFAVCANADLEFFWQIHTVAEAQSDAINGYISYQCLIGAVIAIKADMRANERALARR